MENIKKFMEFKREKDYTWRQLEDISNISIPTLIKIANFETWDDVKFTTLATYCTLKEKFDFDLIDQFKK